MNVPNIGQGSGSVVTLPRENPGSAPNDVQVVKVKDDVDLTHVGWFDANGDGHIDSRSSTDGGDGTLLLPAHAVYLPTYSRTVARPVAVKAAPVADAKAAPPAANDVKAPPPQQVVAPTNDAQTQQAIAAYSRYGQTPTPAPADQAVA